MCGEDGEGGNRGSDIRLGIGMMVGRGAVLEKGRGVKGELVRGASKLLEDRDSVCVEVGNKLVEVCSEFSVSVTLASVSVTIVSVLPGGWLEKGWLSSSALLLLFLDFCLTRSLANLFSLIFSSLASLLLSFFQICRSSFKFMMESSFPRLTLCRL